MFCISRAAALLLLLGAALFLFAAALLPRTAYSRRGRLRRVAATTDLWRLYDDDDVPRALDAERGGGVLARLWTLEQVNALLARAALSSPQLFFKADDPEVEFHGGSWQHLRRDLAPLRCKGLRVGIVVSAGSSPLEDLAPRHDFIHSFSLFCFSYLLHRGGEAVERDRDAALREAVLGFFHVAAEDANDAGAAAAEAAASRLQQTFNALHRRGKIRAGHFRLSDPVASAEGATSQKSGRSLFVEVA